MQQIYFKSKDKFIYNGIQTWSTWYLLSDGTVIQDGGNSQGCEWCRRYKNLSEGASLEEVESYGDIIPDEPAYLKIRIF